MVTKPDVSINQVNLMLLCNECHNKEHGRFEGSRECEFDKNGNRVNSNNEK